MNIKSISDSLKSSLYINAMDKTMFDEALPREASRQLFKRYVHDVELENHSYCNRVCWFCPNSFIDRRSTNKFMADAVFDKILRNLAEIDYDQKLEWSGYAEHFADLSFLDRLMEAKTRLPMASLIVFTNGDYLDEDVVGRVISMGVRMHVDIYPPEGDEFNEEKIEAALNKFRKRTRLTVQKKDGVVTGWGDYEILDKQNRNISSLKIGKYTKENIYTRGGAMDIPKRSTYQRYATCLKPVFHMNVNFDGKGVLCCHTRTDFHSDAIIADLSDDDEDMFTFFAKLGPARKHLLSAGAKCGVCATCDDGDGAPGGILARTDLGVMVTKQLKRLAGRS